MDWNAVTMTYMGSRRISSSSGGGIRAVIGEELVGPCVEWMHQPQRRCSSGKVLCWEVRGTLQGSRLLRCYNDCPSHYPSAPLAGLSHIICSSKYHQCTNAMRRIS